MGSGQGAAAEEVTSVRGGGSCGDNMAATQHHAPGMFVPRVYISPTSSPPRSLDMPGPGISNRGRSRCISCSDSASSLEESSLVSTLLPRRVRTASVCERIKEGTQTGTVTYFCKSRGHGFIRPNDYQPERGETLHSRGGAGEHFVHVSDVESDFVPLKGDKVSYRLCPVPPKFERYQAVTVHITRMTEVPHKRWDTPETPDDIMSEEESFGHPPPADI